MNGQSSRRPGPSSPTWAVYAIDGRRVGVVGTLLDEVEADEIHAAIRDLVRG